MPRLPTGLLLKARSVGPLLVHLLRTCRDLASAKNELRWLREHVREPSVRRMIQSQRDETALLRRLCERRGQGEPLQYILGSEYFGDLEIKCQRGVLIPRPETAASVTHLARLLRERYHDEDMPIRILDLCTGTGCMSFLLVHELLKHGCRRKILTLGVDISSSAVKLAEINRRNLLRQGKQSPRAVSGQSSKESSEFGARWAQALEDMKFVRADIFSKSFLETLVQRRFDVVLSNPPYISSSGFKSSTSRSVRNFEPRLALVPHQASASSEESGDVFYPRLLEIIDSLRANVMLLEVADLEQATRVARMARRGQAESNIEIWRDQPTHGPCLALHDVEDVVIRGCGNGRSVFAFSDLSVVEAHECQHK
ncbi:MAG: hypothetical protein M1820_003577 [Bogoriella megaspora]|nr:MAG: hypothetical protein M1820_003577 [Bogoriella megaspora]